MSTVARHWTPSRTNHQPVSRSSVFVRMQMARATVASLMAELYPRGTKLMGVSSQKLSALRQNGGAVGDVAALMIARPEHALRIASHLLSKARLLSTDPHGCMLAVLCAEQRADSDEDCAQADLLASPDSPIAMREYVRLADNALAQLQAARDVVGRRLAVKESGR
jgi:hypothetical protein